ncbi:MAG: DegT/DnrJ/EryC1/StrS family aminotransferase [Thermodesulfovibrionales bacterium]
MKIQRTIPPAAAPVDLMSILYGIAGLFIGKRYIKKIESEIKSYFGVNHVFLVSSGKAGLTLILQALKSLHPERNEVLIPAYTCFSVPSSIIKAGLKVSLCDIDPSTLDFNYELLEKSVSKKTLCIIPTHLFGIPSDVERILNICKDKAIPVVEDAAQAMGGKYNGELLGTIGDVGFFSLGRGKNITCGSGGIVITNNEMIADAIEKIYATIECPSLQEEMIELCKVITMACFIHPSLYWLPSGLRFLKLGETIFYKEFPIKKLSGIHAGFLRDWQRRLEESNKIRRENSEYFCSALASTLTFHNGACTPFLRLPFTTESKEIKERIYSFSKKEGLGINHMYPSPINEIEEIKNQFNGKTYPSAKSVSETLLTIPTHHLLSKKDKEIISCQVLALCNQLSAVRS